MNSDLFDSNLSLTFDDVLIVPGYTEVLPGETEISAQLIPKINLSIPIISTAIDSVTETRLTISLAREGGVGIVAIPYRKFAVGG